MEIVLRVTAKFKFRILNCFEILEFKVIFEIKKKITWKNKFSKRVEETTDHFHNVSVWL